VWRDSKKSKKKDIDQIKERMSSKVFDPYIDEKRKSTHRPDPTAFPEQMEMALDIQTALE